MDKLITGMDIIKKNNFSDYVRKSASHQNAVNVLSQPLETPSGQTSIVHRVKGMNQKLKDWLVVKSPTSDFTAIHGKSFKSSSNIANFKKDAHNIDLGNSYLTDTLCLEMLHFLNKSIAKNNITKPLNKGTICYCSVHSDDSSSAKIMDEKELFIIKTAHEGDVQFSVMSVEKPEEANAEELKLALENSILKLGLNIERKSRGVFVSFLH